MYSSNLGAKMEADVETNQATPIGIEGRKTVYRVEAFPPVELSFVRKVLGKSLYKELEPEIKNIMVPYKDEFKVPLGLLVLVIGEKITKSMTDLLFSKPLWVEEMPNLVVNVGLVDSLDKHFKASAYTSAWYVGLVSGTPTIAAADTMASHAGWYEVAPYTGARPTLTLGSIASTGTVDNSANKAAYTITAAMVVGGAFLVTLPTASQTSGTLYGGAAFTGGNRTVAAADTLNVTVNLAAIPV